MSRLSRTRPSIVYFIGSHAARCVKIGVTQGMAKSRLRTLQTGCPFRLELFGFAEGDVGLERKLHRTFDPVWLHGEWFELRDKLEDFICYIEGYADAHPDGMVEPWQLEASLHDCVWTGMCYPTMDAVAYEASANRAEWSSVFE